MNFAGLVQSLADADAEFVIIGGWAAVLNGSSYVTQDLDVCYSPEPANLSRIVAALAPFRPRLRDLPAGLPFIWDMATLRNSTILTLTTDLGDIDLLAEVLGVGSFQEVASQSNVVGGFERSVRALNLPALIRSKRAAGRPKDLLVLPELESLVEAQEESRD